jgi:hypothetical protein
LDPLIKSQLLYQLSYAPFPNLYRRLGNTRDHMWYQLAPASARVHIALGWFFVEGVEATRIWPPTGTYSPRNTGRRFSRNAEIPSRMSALRATASISRFAAT